MSSTEFGDNCIQNVAPHFILFNLPTTNVIIPVFVTAIVRNLCSSIANYDQFGMYPMSQVLTRGTSLHQRA